jgi:hypothetical protein
MDDSKLGFFNGLLWYLQARDWALEKIRTSPIGSHLFDLRMHHSLYFVNLFSAVEHVRDHLGREQPPSLAFIARIKSAFGTTQNFKYVRELRNAIVHRGLDPVATGHAKDATVSVLCPAVVQDRSGNNYTCTFKYMFELATHCNVVTNPVIAEALEDLDLFNIVHHIVEEDSLHAAIDSGATMPDAAKAMVKEALRHMDYAAMAREVATARVKEMRILLGQPEVSS